MAANTARLYPQLRCADFREIELRDWHRKIQRRAFEFFEERGRDDGRDWEDWFRAEDDLPKAMKSTARFGQAARHSLFLVLQLAVYAGLQVPVGVALDRLGSRRMLLSGALTMSAGQLALALAKDVPMAVFPRVLVGGVTP